MKFNTKDEIAADKHLSYPKLKVRAKNLHFILQNRTLMLLAPNEINMEQKLLCPFQVIS